ncbi:perlucin-like protein [Folsomia candida]|uniref:perlucin-like protein n=1 Tax=Folsomia candida TaxID=158441 RepID=UPI000B9005F3|nr:perlucin-like protein [Folsomia candida]
MRTTSFSTVVLTLTFLLISFCNVFAENSGRVTKNLVTDSPQDWVWSKKVGPLAKQYVGITQFMSFINFLEYCHKNGMQPAEVTSAEENNALIQYLDDFENPKYFWLGGADIGREGRYYWIASLQEFNYTSWGQGYPNGGREENCATIYGGDGTWFDQYCDNDQIWPICQIVTE